MGKSGVGGRRVRVFRWRCSFVFAALAMVLAGASAAWACSTLAPTAYVSVMPAAGPPGSAVMVSGHNMDAMGVRTDPIRVVWLDSTNRYLSDLASVPGANEFTVSVSIPSTSTAGYYYIGAYRDTYRATPTTFTVTGSSPGGGGPPPVGWRQTGAMSVPRTAHTATVLGGQACAFTSPPKYCGRTLVAGGESPRGLLGSAEFYDAPLGIWTPTGTMKSLRSGHTATQLSGPACGQARAPGYCGQVLVAGGRGGDATAELYDPSTEMWSNTGAMGSARTLHTASLLADGRVLVTGGFGGPGLLSDAELYLPDQGRWVPAAPMTSSRANHAATVLSDGTVLVSGGSALASAEVFDPSALNGLGMWTPTGPMGTARSQHTATVLPSDRVLVAGGVDGSASALASAEVFQPGTVAVAGAPHGPASWSPTGALALPRQAHSATVLPDGGVLAVGGAARGTVLTASERYDAAAGQWRGAASMYVARTHHAATVLGDGHVLVTGGEDGYGGALASSELYGTLPPPPAPVVRAVSPASGPTAGGTAVTISGSGFNGPLIVSFGGVGTSFHVVSDTQINAVSPGHAAGVYDVLVDGYAGGSAATPADHFRYFDPPLVTAISPTMGSTAGGTVVTITGTNLDGAGSVLFGTAAAGYTVNSSTQLTAVAPAHSRGTVDVSVTTPGGTSAPGPGAQFTYHGR